MGWFNTCWLYWIIGLCHSASKTNLLVCNTFSCLRASVKANASKPCRVVYEVLSYIKQRFNCCPNCNCDMIMMWLISTLLGIGQLVVVGWWIGYSVFDCLCNERWWMFCTVGIPGEYLHILLMHYYTDKINCFNQQEFKENSFGLSHLCLS